MSKIISVGTGIPEYSVEQDQALEFARRMFSGKIPNLDRLLSVFHNGEIERRHFVKSLEWYQADHSFSEKNNTFIEKAVPLSIQAIHNCLESNTLKRVVKYSEIDAIFMISTTGIATPSIEARIMNELPFSPNTKRVPIWGLGCAGGAAGLARAHEYCRAYPKAKVLVIAVELCSITFQKDDLSKSNLIGTSLFADGAAAVLIGGDDVDFTNVIDGSLPTIIDVQSTLMKGSLDVMGWEVEDNGLYVVFSKSIPSIVQNWLYPVVEQFLIRNNLTKSDIKHFIAHPGGKKVIEAYEQALDLTKEDTVHSQNILREYGNMSSTTVLFVLQAFLEQSDDKTGDYGMITALGPGFSSELLLIRWH